MSDRLRISLKIRRAAFAESISSSITSAANKSRDAKSCVSQAKKAIVFTVFIACVYRHGLDGRRKILRLYRACAVERVMRGRKVRG